MRISPTTKVVNLKYANLDGKVLDISGDNVGIIYNYLKIKNENNIIIEPSEEIYDSVAIFFSLSSLSKYQSIDLINDVYSKVDENSDLYIWDRLKSKNEIIKDKIVVNLSNDTKKIFNLLNLNPFYEFNIKKIEHILTDKFYITDKIIWDDIIYIKAKKIKL